MFFCSHICSDYLFDWHKYHQKRVLRCSPRTSCQICRQIYLLLPLQKYVELRWYGNPGFVLYDACSSMIYFKRNRPISESIITSGQHPIWHQYSSSDSKVLEHSGGEQNSWTSSACSVPNVYRLTDHFDAVLFRYYGFFCGYHEGIRRWDFLSDASTPKGIKRDGSTWRTQRNRSNRRVCRTSFLL